MRRRRFLPALDSLEGRLPLSGDVGSATDPFEDPFVAPPADMGGSESLGFVADNPSAPPVDSDQHSVGYYPLHSDPGSATDVFDDPFAPPEQHSLAPIDSSDPAS